jgi:hypothetical protein
MGEVTEVRLDGHAGPFLQFTTIKNFGGIIKTTSFMSF